MMAAAVAAMTLGELLGSAAGPHAGIAVTDLTSDSRTVAPGAAFVALAGERSHGLDFAAEAIGAGAVAVLYEPAVPAREVPEPAVAVPGLGARLGELARRFYRLDTRLEGLAGITGTNGKTTVAWLVAQGLTELGLPCGYVGTLGYGTPEQLRPHALTTPDCLTLHRELAGLGTRFAAVEVSSHALAQNRVAGLDFTVAAFTNLSRDHLDWHPSMEAYFEAKCRLFEQPGLRAAVVNADDEWGRALLDRLCGRLATVAVGMSPDAALSGRLVSRGLGGFRLEIAGDFGTAAFDSTLVGSFNAENLLLALGVLVASGHELEPAAAALAAARSAPGRMEAFGGGPALPVVIVDYAHTPRALERVLAEIASIAEGEITCVFGCGGDRDRGKRSAMGEIAARYAAHIVLTDDNPRREDPAVIVADIRTGIGRHPDLKIEHAREQAIAAAIRAAEAGDVVLVAGKGHEQVQIVAGEARPFDDASVVRSALEGRS